LDARAQTESDFVFDVGDSSALRYILPTKIEKYLPKEISVIDFLNAIGVKRLEELNREFLTNKEELFFVHMRLEDHL
jgi:hypothetical protein